MLQLNKTFFLHVSSNSFTHWPHKLKCPQQYTELSGSRWLEQRLTGLNRMQLVHPSLSAITEQKTKGIAKGCLLDWQYWREGGGGMSEVMLSLCPSLCRQEGARKAAPGPSSHRWALWSVIMLYAAPRFRHHTSKKLTFFFFFYACALYWCYLHYCDCTIDNFCNGVDGQYASIMN